MNKITLPKLILLLFCFFSMQLNAQDGYKYTLVYNGGVSFSVGAVPNASTSTSIPVPNQYAFTITLPDGITASITSSLGSPTATFFDGSASIVGMPQIDGYVIAADLTGSGINFPALSDGITTTIVTFDLSSITNASGGSLEIVDLGNTLLNIPGLGSAFVPALLVDLDDGLGIVDVLDPIDNGVTAPSSFLLNTLSTPTVELVGVSLYPNPATDVVNIKGLENNLKSIEVYNIAGQKVIATTNNNLKTINISQLEAGVYFVNLYTENASKTIKLIKKK